MVFFLAGLNEIDPLLYEAASVDGAGVMAKFFHVTMPSLTRMMAFVFVADTVSNFLLFAPVFILTEGGPSNSTNLLMYYAYAHAFADNELGLGLAGVYYPPDRRHGICHCRAANDAGRSG